MRGPLLSKDSNDDPPDGCEYTPVAAKKGRLGIGTALPTTFKNNLKLALSMGFWITIFFIPVTVEQAQHWMFNPGKGDPQGCPQLCTGPGCDEPGGGYTMFTTHIQLGACDMKGYWPNIVQLMFFTVYFTTGATVKLAWQGFIGTMAASFNQAMMHFLFPLGGECEAFGKVHHEEGGLGIRALCTEYTDPNYQKYLWFVWFDVIFFYFLVLASNSSELTMKFALSWHSFYMMTFMGTGKFQPSHSVVGTSMIGIVLAILVTLVPSHHLTITEVVHHPSRMVDIIKRYTTGATESVFHFTEWSRYKVTAKRFGLDATKDQLPGAVVAFTSDLNDSWWETFNLGKYNRIRKYLESFREAFRDRIGGFDDVLSLIAKAIDHSVEDKSITQAELDEIRKIRSELYPLAKELNESVLVILEGLAAQETLEGELPKETLIAQMNQKATKLRDDYHHRLRNDAIDEETHGFKVARHTLNIYVFGMLTLATKVDKLYAKTKEDMNKEVEKYEDEKMFMNELKTELIDTWNLKKNFFTDPTRAAFVLRNTLVLGIAFAMGNFLEGSVFTPYTATMPGTLAVLISHYPGSAFVKNLNRLLAICLGKVFPIIIMTVVAAVGTFHQNSAPIVHVIMVFLYMSSFAYMYYTSPEWSTVGCLVAGFGCYGLVGVNVAHSWTGAIFTGNYRELGVVTAGIAIQIFIDSADTAVRRAFPRTIVVKNMAKLGRSTTNPPVDGCILKAFHHFFQGSAGHDEMWKSLRDARRIIWSQEAMLADCAVKNIIVRGPSEMFKFELYEKSLNIIKSLISQLEQLILVEESDVRAMEEAKKELDEIRQHYRKEIMPALRNSLSALQLALEQKNPGQNNVKVKEEKLIKGRRLDTISMRSSVAARCLHDALDLIFEIEHECYATGSFDLD